VRGYSYTKYFGEELPSASKTFGEEEPLRRESSPLKISASS